MYVNKSKEWINMFPEAVVQRCSVKKVLLDILQNLQENTCARVFSLIKLQAWGTYFSLDF